MKPLHACQMLLFIAATIAATQAATLVLDGAIGHVDPGTFPGVSAGDSYRLQIEYEPTDLDDDPLPEVGRYLLPTQLITLDILGVGTVFESVGGSIGSVFGVTGGPGEIWILGSDGPLHMFILFQDDSQPTVVDDRFPDPFPELSEFDVAAFAIISIGPTVGGPGPLLPELSGEVSTLTIPEPVTPLLVGFGVALAALRSRTREYKLGEQVVERNAGHVPG